MSATAQRQSGAPDAPASEAAETRPQSTPCTSTVVWSNEGFVCVTIVDEPPRPLPDTSCHCGGCRAAQHADWAARFLP
jgi:hypothetical protein